MIGLAGLLNLVTVVLKFRPQAVEEKKSVCRLTSSHPPLGDRDPIQLWVRLPAVNANASWGCSASWWSTS
jgi:hypothetical protein